MTLDGKVQLAATRYYTSGTVWPTKILLGQKEYAELDEIRPRIIRDEFVPWSEFFRRPKFHGLDVYYVDDESYCEVAP